MLYKVHGHKNDRLIAKDWLVCLKVKKMISKVSESYHFSPTVIFSVNHSMQNSKGIVSSFATDSNQEISKELNMTGCAVT